MADLAAVWAAALLAYFVYVFLEIGRHLHYPIGAVLISAFVFAAMFVLMLDHDRAYKRANSLLRIRETERILRVSTQAFGLTFAVTFPFSHLFSRWVVALAVVFVPLLLVIEKQLVFRADPASAQPRLRLTERAGVWRGVHRPPRILRACSLAQAGAEPGRHRGRR